jgi:hypothetical protein
MDDDPGWAWPYWKFKGFQRSDLFTTLHTKYNTVSSPIQDPEAFHHDVYEISNMASTAEEFYTLLDERKEMRLQELNNALESASFEIIGNPKLIGTQQWQYAIQLFRTRSLDSLVRYFASYLPDAHPWHNVEADTQSSTTVSSISDSIADSVDSISTKSSKPFFDDDDDFLTHEPLAIHKSVPDSHLPPSPRSLTMCTDSSVASPVDEVHDDYPENSLPHSGTLSFSENESDVMVHSGTLSTPYDDATSQVDDLETSFSSVSDVSDESKRPLHGNPRGEDGIVSPAESVESETPTPRTEDLSDSYLQGRHTKSTTASEVNETNPSHSPLYTQVLNEFVRSCRKSRRDCSPARGVRRTSPELGRVQKAVPDQIRVRPKGRRRE